MAQEKTFSKKNEPDVTTSNPREQVQLKASGYAEKHPKRASPTAQADEAKESAKTAGK